MPNTLTIETIIGLIAIGQVILGWMTYTFRGNVREEMAGLENRLKTYMHESFVSIGMCVLRDDGTRDMLRATAEEGRAACLAAASRDMETQRHINELIQDIASRTAEAIVRDEKVISKLNEILSYRR